MQTRTEINKAFWLADKRCEQVRCKAVYSEQMGESINGIYSCRFPISNGSIMNDRIKIAQCIYLPGQVNCFSYTG